MFDKKPLEYIDPIVCLDYPSEIDRNFSTIDLDEVIEILYKEKTITTVIVFKSGPELSLTSKVTNNNKKDALKNYEKFRELWKKRKKYLTKR